jgi:hypothetical protein
MGSTRPSHHVEVITLREGGANEVPTTKNYAPELNNMRGGATDVNEAQKWATSK